jgi:C1A family cysteine protease
MLKIKWVLGILAILALLMGSGASFLVNTNLAVAEDREFQLAPLNPAFLEFLEQPYDPLYGHIPHTMDLSHLKNNSVQREQVSRTLPTSFDWRVTSDVTPVKDQNPCGTCWIHGILAAVESRVLIMEDVEYDFSEQNVACCLDSCWVYFHTDRCDAGGTCFKAMDVLAKKGTRLESCDPYDTDTINTEVCNDACTSIKMVTDFRLVASEPDQITEIKNAIYDYGPVSMAYYHNNSYLYTGNIYYYPDCTETTNHEVCIVGWDDSIEWPGGAGNGAWIVKNSWGASWGNSGYFYMCYGSGNMEDVVSYRYKDYDPNETLYYWDEAGLIDGVGTGSTETLWGASVFTSAQDGNLTHVDFWTTENNAEYEIYVYNGSFGTELTSETGTCAEMGYYSIPLTAPVPMTDGQQFTIALKLTNPPGFEYSCYPIPVEYEITDYCEPTIQTGVCFVSIDGSYWEDAGDVYDWNICLRARINSSHSEVWVDDNWAGIPLGEPADGHIMGYDAFATIQEGIDAVEGSTVHVAEGTYYENITLVDGVEVLGAGAGVTTIDGGGSGPVVTADGAGPTTVLDGFTITNGYAEDGGGMYNYNSSPTVTNCVFSGNSTYSGGYYYGYGGGMYNYNSSPTVTNCTFSGNSANWAGGGMCNENNSSAVVTNCTFSGNDGGYYGGGMCNWDYCSPTVTSCTFSSNVQDNNGGGMYNNNYSSPTVTNCIFSGNDGWFGGGMCSEGYSSPTVTNCTFYGNSTHWDGYGGGMSYHSYSSPTVTNCIISTNTASMGGGIYADENSSPIIDYNDVWNNSADNYSGCAAGAHDISQDPLFVDPGTGDFHLQSGSPCIDVGDNSAPSLPSTDFEGDSRPADGDWDSAVVADMGADEYVPVLGLLRVESSPAVPTTMFANGIPVNDWGLDWVKMLPGEYILSFSDVPGYLTPTIVGVTYYYSDGTHSPVIIHSLSDPIEVLADTTTEVTVDFTQLGYLRVQISPWIPDAPTIFVNGKPMNDWGLWVALEPGQYIISFQEIDGYLTPPPIEVTVTAGGTKEVFGNYETGQSWES